MLNICEYNMPDFCSKISQKIQAAMRGSSREC